MPAYAQYTCYKTVEQRNGDEPLPRAILWGGLGKAHALIHYRDQHLNVVDDLRLDKEWRIKQINRDSILFARYSEKRYVEYKLESQERPKYHNDWSFYGLPITTWEAMELLADAFGHNAVMHNLACGAAKLGVHDTNAMNLLYKILPPRLRARLDGDTMYVLPIDCADGESWTAPLTRKRKYNYKALEIMYPSLKEKGILVSRGDDIQYVLRTISTGGKVPISFPKDLHFAVYCTFNKVSFSKILSDIVLINQCSIIEREKGIEIIRWPGNTNKKSEAIVNAKIAEDLQVVTNVMSIEEAKKSGAMALFGEKYGAEVRVVAMGDFSKELCGGTHVAHTGLIQNFKIVSESGVAAGVRRIEAITGSNVTAYYKNLEAQLNEAASIVKSTPANLLDKLAGMMKEMKALNSEIESLKAKAAQASLSSQGSEAKEINGVKVIATKVSGVDMNGLRDLADNLSDKLGEGVIVIASDQDGKVNLVVKATDEAQKKGAHAGNLIKEIASLVGGGGGGRPNMAQAGGKNPSGIDACLAKAVEVLGNQIA